MDRFDQTRRGYSPNQVEGHINELERKYDERIKFQDEVIAELKKELEKTRAKLKVFEGKDEQISNALVVAMETAKEIEAGAKAVYDLEIKRIRVLYKKWFAILEQIKAIYPDVGRASGTSKLMQDFEEAIIQILDKQEELSSTSIVGEAGEKIYAKTLLSRMWGTGKPTSQTRVLPIERVTPTVVEIGRASCRERV